MEFKKRFVAHFFFVQFCDISLGFHICLSAPNIEIHVPFGFFKIGWQKCSKSKFGFVKSPSPLWGGDLVANVTEIKTSHHINKYEHRSHAKTTNKKGKHG